jgi:RNase P subunit RPR2
METPVHPVAIPKKVDEYSGERRAVVIWRCKGCGTKLRVSAHKSGSEIHCPKCNKEQRVPKQDQS